jgi:uncharacterized repeat protein (TIGR01451 family)
MLLSLSVVTSVLLSSEISVLAEGVDNIADGESANALAPKAVEAYGKLPLRFELNDGQTDSEVRYMSRGSGYTLFLTPSGAVLRLSKSIEQSDTDTAPLTSRAPQTESVLRLSLRGANPRPVLVGEGELQGRSNYLIGDERAWITNVPNFERVRYQSVYPGVDLIYYGNQGQLEYDFVVAPGTDTRSIRLRFDGAQRLRVNKQGDLIISTKSGELRQRKPIAYQETIEGERVEVSARYRRHANGRVGIEVGAYDRTLPLVIDPVLIYSTFLGGSGSEQGLGVAVGADGSAYVTGSTASTNFPGPSPIQSGKDAFNDAFVLKLNPAGNALVYATYLGGNGDDISNAIAVDSGGNAYIAGQTGSGSFPRTGGVLQDAKDGGLDAFIAKLNSTGTALVYSTYLGGNATDQIFAIAVDAAGAAYVAGVTSSANFPRFPLDARNGSPVFKSTNAAANWAASGNGLTASAVNDFAVAPTDANIIYAATNLGVYKSTDGGALWQLTGTVRTSTAPPSAKTVAVDPSNPDIVYAGNASSGGIYKSTNGGALYEIKNNGISFPIINSLAIDPVTPTTLYAGTTAGIYKSTNGGESWAEVRGDITGSSPFVYKIVIDPTNSQIVYAGANRGVFKTINGGTNWTTVNNGLSVNNTTLSVASLSFAPSQPQTIYAACFENGVYKTTDGGASWTSSSNGLLITSGNGSIVPSINVVLVDPSSPATIYAAPGLGGGGGVFKSTDSGANWAASNNGLTNKIVLALAARGSSPVTILAGTSVGTDGFVAKVNASATQLEYLKFIGGSEIDDVRGIAVGSDGNAYVVGTTSSTDLPVVNAFQPQFNGTSDAFVARLNATGSAYVYSTYLGGALSERGTAIAVGPGGESYVTGQTFSDNFPVLNALQPTISDPTFFGDAFVTKLAPNGQSLAYSTYLGGESSDQGLGIALGTDGSAFVTGVTNSDIFPVVNAPGTQGFVNDAFVSRLAPSGTSLLFSTYLGGTGNDRGNAIAVDRDGNAYVVGNTTSSNFPLVNPLRPAYGGALDAFIAKIGVSSDLSLILSDSRDPVMVNNNLTYTLKVTNNGPSPATGVRLTDTLPGGVTFVSTTPTQGTCTRSGVNVVCELGDLPASGSATVSIVVTPTATGNITNTAQVTGNEPDVSLSDNSATETTKVSASPSINGRVTGAGGIGMAGVLMSLTGSQTLTTLTDSSGFYQFAELPAGGTYVVTPTKDNFSFDPPSVTFNNLSTDQTADFIATACTWSLSSSNQSFTSGGGTGSVTVTSLHGCPWTAQSNVDWISITSGGSGTGNGTVNFNVAPATAPRVGRLTIAGKNFTVFQEFNSCGQPGFVVASYNLSVSATAIQAADLNGDGRSDLVTANGGGLSGAGIEAAVLLNDGTGHFTSSNFDTGQGAPQGFALGDFNGDARPDIVFTDYNSAYVTIFFNNGSGAFGQTPTKVTFSTQGQTPLTRRIQSADLNRDGKADLLVSTPGTNGIQVLLGNGNGSFTQAAPVNFGSLYLLIAVADLNADAVPDLILGGGGSDSRQLAVRLGEGTGNFGAAIVSPDTKITAYAATGDFNGDGKADIAASDVVIVPGSPPQNPAYTNAVSILLGDGAGHFVPRSSFATSNSLPNITVGDFNADAKPDVAFTTGGSDVTVLSGDGTGGFGTPIQINTGASNSTGGVFGIVASDFDGDTKLDIAASDYSRGAVVLKNTCVAAPSISGRVTDSTSTRGLGGVTINISGAQTATAQTDEGGNYFIGNLTSGANYVVTPVKESYRFNPASISVNGLDGNRQADFVATPITVQFTQMHYVVGEGDGSISIVVSRSGDTSGVTTVDYATINGTASARSDYTTAVGTLRFSPGETTKSFKVLLTDDALVEGFESLTLTLGNPSGAILGSSFLTNVVMEIRDNDTTASNSNPIDDARFYVRQHYADFLNREPDAGGLQYWTEQITGNVSNGIPPCPPNTPTCEHIRRINVSAAFFVENEFQRTGGFVYRFYKASYGTRPTFQQFNADRSRVPEDAQLEQNKQAFAADWVQRPEFIAKYPASLSGPAFVDALLLTVQQNSGVDLSSQRASLINDFNTGGRALVVRQVAENANFAQAEYNAAFVLMQYFGYLQRDPDDGGYQFWLGILNNRAPNNFRAMVCAFLTSAEYQQRFGSAVTRFNTDCAVVGP